MERVAKHVRQTQLIDFLRAKEFEFVYKKMGSGKIAKAAKSAGIDIKGLSVRDIAKTFLPLWSQKLKMAPELRTLCLDGRGWDRLMQGIRDGVNAGRFTLDSPTIEVAAKLRCYGHRCNPNVVMEAMRAMPRVAA